MGFLKRIFSIGSKKGKKRSQTIKVDSGLRGICEEEEHEANVGRLLRSSSTRYAVVSELDYISLPPMPHPINEVIQTPAASTASIASASISQRGTYNVTVHRRKQLSLTEFPNANRDLDDGLLTPQQSSRTLTTSKDNSHLLGLRSDPSVVSLLDMYDEHGCIPAEAFSNSPPCHKQERAQTQRSGSTLRQLLGNPPSLNSRAGNDASEGDISWAERFLGEINSVSSASSLGSPITPDALFNTELPRTHIHDTTLISDDDLSTTTYENPAISSMEVELSLGSDSAHPSKDSNPYGSLNLTTPQRASQVFGFLTSKRKPPSLDDHQRSVSHLSDDDSLEESVYDSLITAAIPIPSHIDTLPLTEINSSDTHPARSPSYIPNATHYSIESSSTITPQLQILRGSRENTREPMPKGKKPQAVQVLMTGPTKVIVTAPTPSISCETPTRIPRGPRAHHRTSSTSSKVRRTATLPQYSTSNEKSIQSMDMFTPVLPRRKSHRRTSRSSSSKTSHTDLHLATARLVDQSSRPGRSTPVEADKENGVGLTAEPDLPSTPLRSRSMGNPRESRSLFRAVVDPSVFIAPVGMVPSPASSSELSPVGKQLMVNLRQQRTRAREADRAKSRRTRFSYLSTNA